jgi:hypothetical protein
VSIPAQGARQLIPPPSGIQVCPGRVEGGQPRAARRVVAANALITKVTVSTKSH